MRTFGHNSFVMSGANGVNLYDKIMTSVENCVEFNTRYKIDKVSGNTYTIQKSITKDERIEYNIGVWKGNSTDIYSCPYNTEKCNHEGNHGRSRNWNKSRGYLLLPSCFKRCRNSNVSGCRRRTGVISSSFFLAPQML